MNVFMRISPKLKSEFTVGRQDNLGGGVAISGSVSESAFVIRANLGISGLSPGSRDGAAMAGSAAQVAQCMSIIAGASAGF
jgi:hypothetical protein